MHFDGMGNTFFFGLFDGFFELLQMGAAVALHVVQIVRSYRPFQSKSSNNTSHQMLCTRFITRTNGINIVARVKNKLVMIPIKAQS